ELKEEDRLVRQREEEANIVSWDNVQAMIDADNVQVVCTTLRSKKEVLCSNRSKRKEEQTTN
ncbi:hypothetical protein Tco_0358451, partial [Tanacetum coccineum]